MWTQKRIKYWVQIVCYYLLPLCLACLLGFLIYTDQVEDFTGESGEITLNLLFLLLLIRPLSQIFWKVKFFKTLVSLRRELGIAMFYLALAHSASYFPIIWQFPQVLSTPFVYIGLIALSNTFILYLTSNNWSLIKLKKHWKWLHRTAYFILTLSLVHAYLATNDTENLIKAVIMIDLLALCNGLVWNKFRIPVLAKQS